MVVQRSKPYILKISNLDASCTEEDLHVCFARYVLSITNVRIQRQGGASQGVGYITFESRNQAVSAAIELNRAVIKEKPISIKGLEKSLRLEISARAKEGALLPLLPTLPKCDEKSTVVKVSNITVFVNAQNLSKLMSKFGHVLEMCFRLLTVRRVNPTYAWVRYAKHGAAVCAVRDLDGKPFLGSFIQVQFLCNAAENSEN